MKLYQGDSRHMDQVPDESVHCIVTSPPYWGLRKYAGCPDLIFGGKVDCQHKWGSEIIKLSAHHAGETNPGKEGYTKNAGAWNKTARQFCSICGAWYGQFGSEPMIDLYVANSMEFLKECWRVLRKDGVLWWNIGDTAASGKGTCFNPGGGDSRNTFAGIQKKKVAGVYPLDLGNVSTLRSMGLKPGELSLIPWRIALAAQQAGWYVKSDVIWNKTNPMPESVHGPYWTKHQTLQYPDGTPYKKKSKNEKRPEEVDYCDCPGCEKCLPNNGLVLVNGAWRPTNTHEYILMLTKTNRYYCDKEAVREPQTGNAHSRGTENGNQEYAEARGSYKDFYSPETAVPGGRNLRSVWIFPTAPNSTTHYASFPPDLVRRCILASTSEYGVCSKCGKPWVRVLEKNNVGHNGKTEIRSNANRLALLRQSARENSEEYIDNSKTIGWKATCACENAQVIPATVLDPFGGSGTTSMVATKLGRRSIIYELSPDYCKLIIERNRQLGLMEANDNESGTS